MNGRPGGGSRVRRLRLAAGAVGAGAIITGVSVAALSPPSQPGYLAGHRGAPAASAAGSVTRDTPARPARASAGRSRIADKGPRIIAGGGLAKTALRWPRGLKGQMVHWNDGPGGSALSAVTGRLGHVQQDVAVQLYPKARQACASLVPSVQDARDAPSIPDLAMQRAYASALGEIAGAVTDCRQALSARLVGEEDEQVSVNKGLLSESMAKFAAGSDLLYKATAEIRLLHR